MTDKLSNTKEPQMIQEVNMTPLIMASGYLPCFKCGETKGGRNAEFASDVADEAIGEHVVRIFREADLHAVLDNRKLKPDHVLVRIGGCESHSQDLEVLMRLIRLKGNRIIPEIIQVIKA